MYVHDIISVTCDLQLPARYCTNCLTCVAEDQDANNNQKTFTLEDVFNSTMKPQSYNLRWISGGLGLGELNL